MDTYAEITDGIVTNTLLVDSTTESGAAFLGTTPGLVKVTDFDPMPGPGWTTADGGQIFEPPAPPPSSAIVATEVQATAQNQLQQLVDSLPGQIVQAEADAATLAQMMAGQPLTADQIAALQRTQSGWLLLLPALQALVTATGLAPPAITT